MSSVTERERLNISCFGIFLQNNEQKKHRKNLWLNELDDIIRGASGGFLFGIPLLYTMEVWWIGSSTKPPQMLGAIASTFVAVFLLNRTEGFRKTKDISLQNALIDSVEAIAIGTFCAALVLFLLREITLETPLQEALGKVIFEGLPFSLGVAIARAVLSGDRNQSSDDQEQDQKKETTINATLADIGATLIGATIIAFNIAHSYTNTRTRTRFHSHASDRTHTSDRRWRRHTLRRNRRCSQILLQRW